MDISKLIDGRCNENADWFKDNWWMDVGRVTLVKYGNINDETPQNSWNTSTRVYGSVALWDYFK